MRRFGTRERRVRAVFVAIGGAAGFRCDGGVMARQQRDKQAPAPDVCHEGCAERAQRDNGSSSDGDCHVDRLIARIAGRQLGLITWKQLVAVGLSRGEISRRVARGLLHPVHRGVYAVGHLHLPPFADLRAATLACGDRSLVCRRSAIVLWRMARGGAAEVDVLVVGENRRSRKGIRVHRTATLARKDTGRRHGVPVTAPARTLVDFAEVASDAELESALNEARVLRLVDDGHLRGAIARAGRRRGAARLRALLDAELDRGFTRTEIERVMRRLVRRAGLPEPEVNAGVLGREVDFLWREQRLIVETDGRQAHGTPRAFERDRRRDAELQAAGYRVLRFTWRQVTDEPEYVVATIAATLAVLR